MKKIGTLCARAGSKGIPGKNIRFLLGKPLLAFSIESAKAAGVVDFVVVKGCLRTGVENFQHGGCLGEVIVTPKKSMYDFSLAIRYLFQRSFSPATLEQLYDDLVDVQLRPLNKGPDNNPCPKKDLDEDDPGSSSIDNNR